tara:strand:+ start:9221 stop:9421 length:201 start_codon:yes stop_codon:yes gene_type:complete
MLAGLLAYLLYEPSRAIKKHSGEVFIISIVLRWRTVAGTASDYNRIPFLREFSIVVENTHQNSRQK